MGAERVPRLPPAKARERMLLEEENVRAFEELLRELGAESLLLIGGMGVRALVGGWAGHGRYTLDIDTVSCVSLDRVAAAAGGLGFTVEQRDWGLELSRASTTSRRYLVKIDVGMPAVASPRGRVFRYEPSMYVLADLEASTGYVARGVRVQRVEVLMLGKMASGTPKVPHDLVDLVAVDRAWRGGRLSVDLGLLRAKLAEGDSCLDVREFLEKLRSSPMGPFEELRRAALSTSFAKAVSTLLEELGC
ncbi:MAG: hypothetical protein LM565_06685 [Thermofilum sp.]|nr:hypothetical protein [Thermofilum sp.]